MEYLSEVQKDVCLEAVVGWVDAGANGNSYKQVVDRYAQSPAQF